MLAVTPSKLSEYLRCPHKYKLKFIDKIGEFGSESPALAFGSAMHGALQEMHSVQSLNNPSDLVKLLNKHWSARSYSTSEESDHYFTKGYQALRSYQQEFGENPTDKTLGTEVYMSYIFKLGSQQVRFGCKADRICVHADGTLEIMDYKTNRSGKVPTEESLLNDLSTFLYYVLSRITYPDYELVRVSFLNVLTLEKVSIEYTPEQITLNKRALLNCLNLMLSNCYSPSPSEACSWCQYQDNCPFVNRVVDFASIT